MCAPKKNLVFERHKFFTRKQQPGEKARLFLNALKTIAKRCELENMTVEDFLLHRVLLGMSDTKLQSRLTAKRGLTLVQVMDVLNSNELSASQWQEIHPMAEEEIGAVGARNKYGARSSSGYKQGGRPHDRRGDRETKKRDEKEFDCKKCGTKHRYRNCPAFHVKCHSCKDFGHYERFCNKKRSVNAVENRSDSDDDSLSDRYIDEFLGMVHSEEIVDIKSETETDGAGNSNIDLAPNSNLEEASLEVL